MKWMNLLFRDRSLVYKFLVLPGIPALLATLLIVAGALTSQQAVLEEKAQKRALLLIGHATLTLANDFVIYNKSLLDSIVDSLNTDAEVVYAMIVDSSDGRILAHSDHDRDGRILDPAAAAPVGASNRDPSVYELSNDIKIAGSTYGVLKIGFSLEGVHREIAAMRNRFLWVVFAAFGLGTLFSIILGRLISVPIKELVEQTQKVASGNLDTQIVYRSKDILGQLAREFNKMVVELKAKQQQIAENEARLRRIVENMPIMMDALDEEYNIIAWNRECERVTGYRAAEMIGNPRSFEILYPDPAYRQKMVSELDALGFDFRHKEYALTGKDGAERIISWSNVSGESPIPGWFTWAVGVDVTERKALEEKLVQTQKMEALGALAGGVAHDLNNILGGVVGYPDLLLLKMEADNPLRKPIQTIRESGLRAAAIVQDLLTLARRGVSVMEVTNIGDIVRSYLNSPEYSHLMQQHPGIQVENRLSGELLNCQGSPVHLSKMVMNLVSNAAEAMPDGGTILISTHNQYVDRPIKGYDAVQEGEYAVLTVSDSGIGIPQEDLERIFEPFYTKKKMGRSGSGLGMAVVWGTVKDHRGYIDVRSTPGQGTTFEIYLPATRGTLTANPPQAILEAIRGSGETILVVDDVQVQRQIACEMVQNLGYRTHAVPSGEAAVAYLKKNQVDMVLLDMIMEPHIDGLETYRRIIELRPEQKTILVSGFSETDAVREAQRLGAGPYVKKPYTLHSIGSVLKAELGGKRA